VPDKMVIYQENNPSWCIQCIKAESQHSHLAAGTCLSINPIWIELTILKQWVKHRINNMNTLLTKVVPTFDLCFNTEATNAECLCCPLTIEPNLGDIFMSAPPWGGFLSQNVFWCCPVNSSSTSTKLQMSQEHKLSRLAENLAITWQK
jgi:hypothetical protein